MRFRGAAFAIYTRTRTFRPSFAPSIKVHTFYCPLPHQNLIFVDNQCSSMVNGVIWCETGSTIGFIKNNVFLFTVQFHNSSGELKDQ